VVTQVDAELTSVTFPEPPRLMTDARVDEKGRLKLPVALQQYIKSFGDNKVFVTSMDGTEARIYPISVWARNEEILQRSAKNAKQAKNLHLLAMIYGHETEIDNQGRVLLPTNLRRELNLEGGPVWLSAMKGRVTVMSNQRLEEFKREALAAAPQALETMEAEGLL